MKLIIISGRSGSGKSVVLQTLEDLHYYCVDNLPPILLAQLMQQLEARHLAIAVSIDSRNLTAGDTQLTEILQQLKTNYDCSIVYLDADENILLKRFKETRRRHPLTTETISLKEALDAETTLLNPLAELADLKLETSQLTAPKLRNLAISYFQQTKDQTLSILLESFGYKHGLPLEADLVFDSRCLPNPYWEKQLREKTGEAAEVIQFFEQQPECVAMRNDIQHFLEKWLPAYEAEQRKYLTIAIGCTGGHHRSVYLVNELGKALKKLGYPINIRHRDLS